MAHMLLIAAGLASVAGLGIVLTSHIRRRKWSVAIAYALLMAGELLALLGLFL